MKLFQEYQSAMYIENLIIRMIIIYILLQLKVVMEHTVAGVPGIH